MYVKRPVFTANRWTESIDAGEAHRPGKYFLCVRAGYVKINRMDLIFAVLGLLALLVDSIRCQGVYGECASVQYSCTRAGMTL